MYKLVATLLLLTAVLAKPYEDSDSDSIIHNIFGDKDEPDSVGPGQRPLKPGQEPLKPGQEPLKPGQDQEPLKPGQRPNDHGQRPCGSTHRPCGSSHKPCRSGKGPCGNGYKPGSDGQIPGGLGLTEGPGQTTDNGGQSPGGDGRKPDGNEQIPDGPGQTPVGDGQTLGSDEHTPGDSGPRPGGDGQTSGDPGVNPNGGDKLPSGDGKAPGGDELTPGGDEFNPEVDRVTPGGDGLIPEGDGVTPGGNGLTPGADELIPEGDGVSPGEDGLIPEVDGVTPGGDSLIPEGHGLTSGGHGLSPGGDGVTPGGSELVPAIPGQIPEGVELIPVGPGQTPGRPGEKPDEDVETPCLTKDKEPGVCVRFYLCDNNNTIITDGSGILDVRFGDGPCPSYMDICCRRPQSEPLIVPTTPKPDYKPEREGCGWRNPKGVGFRIIGDTHGETKFGEFPWMVAIMKIEPLNIQDPNGRKLFIYVGGGSLIHPSVILTTAHHVANTTKLVARAGEWDTQTKKEMYPHQNRDVAKVIIHKDFNKGNLFYDIALLFLAKPMDAAPNVGVACLPPPRERVPEGTRCFTTGWGKDKFNDEAQYQVILKKVDVPVVERRNCQGALRKTRLGRLFELHTSFMCAGGEPAKDACTGDGGSPLVCPIEFEEDRYVQNGMVAWGIGCGEDGTPGVYVDVSNLRNWIDDKVKGNGYTIDTYSYTV